MPWAPVHEPSLALGILKQCLINANYRAQSFHLSADLLRWVSAETYQFVADSWAVNEFLFTGEISGSSEPDTNQLNMLEYLCDRYVESSRSKKYTSRESLLSLFLDLREKIIPRYLDVCADRILNASPSIIGFSCMFDQTMASLALANRIKNIEPSIQVVLGGYALYGEPGKSVSQAFPWVDKIVIGDGEEVIVEIASQTRRNSENDTSTQQIVNSRPVSMDSVPTPNYDDWFNDISDLHSKHSIEIKTHILPVEASRGCWWGEHRHCVFCGIDEESLKYRVKTADRTIESLRQLRMKHGYQNSFRFSDYIMPNEYFKTFLPTLAREETPFDLEGEIKANQSPDRVKLLAEAGFRAVQPGIESFSSPVLRKMDKGVRGIDNVQLLKEAHVSRLVIYYNILYGFPNEDPTWYLELLSRIPVIYHLMPPISRTEVVVTRHAPLQTDPLRFGIIGTAKHAPCYETLFPKEFLAKSKFDLDEYCYYFDRNYEYAEGTYELYHSLDLQINHWKKQHRERFVELSESEIDINTLEITDSRFDCESTSLLEGAAAVLLKKLSRKKNLPKLRLELNRIYGESEICNAVEVLRKQRLLWEEGDICLSVTIPKEITDNHRQSSWKNWWMALKT